MQIYLDHNATTPLAPQVLEAMLPYLREHYGNPSSVHGFGRRARAAIERAREQVAHLVNAQPIQVIFTSGGTEANNLAVKGVLSKLTPARVASSAVEHASVRIPLQVLSRQGWQVDTIAVDGQGRASFDSVEQALHDDTRLVSIMLANNETGVIQDIAGISTLIRRTGAFFHTDAVQAAGKIGVDFKANGAHTMSLSAHKMYGPKGVGALVADESLAIEPLLHGGGHERGRRGGTENVAAIVGFGAAAELVSRELNQRQADWRELRSYLEYRLYEIPNTVIFAEDAARLPNTVLLSVSAIPGTTLLMNLDKRGITVSNGSACSSSTLAPSHVLLAMGVPPAFLDNVLRISLGQGNTRADIDCFIDALQEELERFEPWARRDCPAAEQFARKAGRDTATGKYPGAK